MKSATAECGMQRAQEGPPRRNAQFSTGMMPANKYQVIFGKVGKAKYGENSARQLVYVNTEGERERE